MARQQMFIHGNAVRMRFPGGKGAPFPSPHTAGRQMDGAQAPEGSHIEWSDVVGLPGRDGMKFRGRPGPNFNTFFAAVPTPTVRDDADVWTGAERRARLARVGIRFAADPGVTIIGLKVLDGAREIEFPFPDPLTLGGDARETWDRNINFFDDPALPWVDSCICIEFQVRFDSNGHITFTSVGGDFIV
jgi:hypothetical protein